MARTIPHTAPCDPGLEGYRRYKCKCQRCKDANSKYARDRRARLNKQAATPANVRRLRAVATTPQPAAKSPTAPPEPGDVEAAVVEECSGLTVGGVSVTEVRPAAVMQARKMAHILDDPRLLKDHPTASRQLTHIMESLHAGAKTKSKGRLVAIQKMTNRRPLEGNSG